MTFVPPLQEMDERRLDARLFRRVLRYLGPYRGPLILAVLLLLAAAGLQILEPLFIKWAIDRHITPGVLEGLWGLAALYLIVLALEGTVRYWQVTLTQFVGQRVMGDLRGEIFRKVQRLPLTYFDRNPVGRILTRLTSDVENLQELLTAGLVSAAGDLVSAVGIIAIMLYLDLKLSLAAFAILPLLLVAVILFRRRAREAHRLMRARLAQVHTHLQEDLTGITVIQAFNREGLRAHEFARLNAGHRDAALSSISAYATFYPAVELIAAIGLALILWHGGARILHDTLTLGVLVAFITYLEKLFAPIRDLSEKYSIMQSAMASSEQVFKLLDHPEEPRLPTAVPKRLHGDIEFRHVSFGYRPGEPVLRDISFRIGPGERVALVGPTGAGKTTIAALLTRLYEIQEGSILLDGVDIHAFDPVGLRKRIGLVLQDPFLFADTVEANLRAGRPDLDAERLRTIVEAVQVEELLAGIPGGLEARVAERGASLSMGERQLLSLGRALIYDPDILILDEATSGVDFLTEHRLQQAIPRLDRPRTTLIIAHRLASTLGVSRVLVFYRGKLCQDGAPWKLLQQDGPYRRLYLLQTNGHDPSGRGIGTEEPVPDGREL